MGIIYLYEYNMTQKKIKKSLTDPDFVADLQSYGIEHLWLFGSYATWDATEKSDVDLLYIKNPNIHKWWWILEIYSKIEEKIWKEIDFVEYNHIHPLIRDSIYNSATQLW